MSKTKIALAFVIMIPLLASWKMRTLQNDIADRFPDLDPKLRRKTFRKMLAMALTSQLPDIDDHTDEEMDLIFLEIYESLAK